MGLLASVGVVSRASRSRPTIGCARSSRTPSSSATPPPAPFRSRRVRRVSPTTPTRPGSTCSSRVATSSWTRRRRSSPRGVIPSESDGARKLNARIAFFYPHTGITPAMCMRLPGIGSQYLIAMRDSDGQFLDGDRNYRLALPPEIPESRFWWVMLYDRQTRSMLQTDQPKPDIGSQSGSVQTNPDGSTDAMSTSDPPPPQENQQLDPNRPRQGLLHHPPSLQPPLAILRQDLATERDRTPHSLEPTRTTSGHGPRRQPGAAR